MLKLLVEVLQLSVLSIWRCLTQDPYRYLFWCRRLQSIPEIMSRVLAKEKERALRTMPMSKALVRGAVKSKTCLTYTGWQGLIPSSPLPSQTDQHPAASQCVARVAIKGYRAASEVPFVVDLVAKLRDARVLAFDEFKTWSERNSINFPHMFNSQKPLAQDYINCFPLKKNALLAKRNTIWRIVFFWLRLERDPRDLVSQLQVEISVSPLPHSQ